MNKFLKKFFICILLIFTLVIIICSDNKYNANPIGSDWDFNYTLKESDYRVSLRDQYVTKQAVTWFDSNVGFTNLTVLCNGYFYYPGESIRHDINSFVIDFDETLGVTFYLSNENEDIYTLFDYTYDTDSFYINDSFVNNFIYITNSSFPLIAVWNYFFRFQHHIPSGPYSFTSNNLINITNLSNNHVNFNISGTSIYVYTVGSNNYQSFYQLGINLTNNTDYSLTYLGNNILYSVDPFYLTSEFKNLFFDNQWIDAVFWNWLDTVGVWFYIPFTTEQATVNDLIDTYVNIPIKVTHDMLDWTAFGVNVLVAFGIVLAVIIGIKIIKRLY